ncbi:hypothetical protein DI09_616p10 [Mitosporidium daphniae]|uniref:Uncharacterized protein n=1 Tax=Mitosporidium daphniae TaxID=1485682 RepID=A0A098VNH9_9MICR|nr:hypothetical protein DI09_616p10 [Mitosporidium daphniae]|eukprot:XP_013237068.1 uncharacterized protein DI09_616p10 [Mitosporidium daphniae]
MVKFTTCYLAVSTLIAVVCSITVCVGFIVMLSNMEEACPPLKCPTENSYSAIVQSPPELSTASHPTFPGSSSGILLEGKIASHPRSDIYDPDDKNTDNIYVRKPQERKISLTSFSENDDDNSNNIEPETTKIW